MDTSSFINDVTFSKPIELDLAFLGKYHNPQSFLSEKSSTVQSPIEDVERSREQEQKSKLKIALSTALKTSKNLLVKYWFLLGLLIAILLAWGFPDVARKGGHLRAEWSIKWGAVIVIFFISGISLRTRILAQTFIRVRLHLLIQIINLVLIPFFIFGLILFFFKAHMAVNSLLLIGVVIAQSTPTTVSSNVVMTKNAKGNEASALMNAALGNVLGIFVSPALVSCFQGPLLAASPEDESPNTAGGSVDFATVLKQLGLTVLLPLIVGQVFQILFTETCAKIKVKWRLSDVSSFCLLLMVWSVFSDAIHAGSFSAVSGKDIAIIAVFNLVFYVLFSVVCFLLARLPYPKKIFGTIQWLDRLQYSREDTVAVMFCGATKTVAMGVPLINVLYQKGDPGTVGVLSTPLLLYHVEQLILGNIEVEILKKWVSRGQKRDQQKVQNDSDLLPQTSATTTTGRDEESGMDSSVTQTNFDGTSQTKL